MTIPDDDEGDDDDVSPALLAKELATKRNRDILLINGPMTGRLWGGVVAEVSRHKERESIDVILVTTGGDANAAYKIGRLLQREYDQITIVVPSLCKSAGTLLAVAAHELVITDFGELGPLDVQKVEHGDPFSQRSGLATKAAFESLIDHSWSTFEAFMLRTVARSEGIAGFNAAAEIAAKIVVGLMTPVYQQVRADAAGEDHRDLSIAIEYGRRLADHSGNLIMDGSGPHSTLGQLVHAYPSHDFVIDRDEAKELFANVRRAGDDEYRLLVSLMENAAVPNWQDDDAVITMLSCSEPTSDGTVSPETGESDGKDDEDTDHG